LAEEIRGVPYEADLSLQICEELAANQRKIEAILPFKATINAAKGYFFTEEGLDLPPYGVTPKGEPQLTEQIVTRMVSDGVQWATEWRDWQKLSRAQSMWYRAYAQAIGPDGRLRTSFRQ